MYNFVDTLASSQHDYVMVKNARSCLFVPPCCTINLHAFPLHDVDVVFGAGVIAIRAQGSPEVGPELAVSRDKGTNYFSARDRESW